MQVDESCCILCEHANLETRECTCEDDYSHAIQRCMCYTISKGSLSTSPLDDNFTCDDEDCESCSDFKLRSIVHSYIISTEVI